MTSLVQTYRVSGFRMQYATQTGAYIDVPGTFEPVFAVGTSEPRVNQNAVFSAVIMPGTSLRFAYASITPL